MTQPEVHPSITTADCTAKWRTFRRLRALYFGSVAIGFGGTAIAALFVAQYPEMAFVAAMLIGGALFLYSGSKWSRWDCPRCGEPFLKKDNPFTSECAHCGLAIGSCE
jgi:hypothetical protein